MSALVVYFCDGCGERILGNVEAYVLVNAEGRKGKTRHIGPCCMDKPFRRERVPSPLLKTLQKMLAVGSLDEPG